MATRMGLQESLKEITALLGLLRSDLIELADTPADGARRAPVMSHIHWIADRFDQLGPALAVNNTVRRSPQPPPTARRNKPAPRKTTAPPTTKRIIPIETAEPAVMPPEPEALPPEPAAVQAGNSPPPIDAGPQASSEPARTDQDDKKPPNDTGETTP